jgi:hypothetical protein
MIDMVFFKIRQITTDIILIGCNGIARQMTFPLKMIHKVLKYSLHTLYAPTKASSIISQIRCPVMMWIS